MSEQEGIREIKSITKSGWETVGTGGTNHETFFNKSTQQWLRINPAYENENTLSKELKVFRASLAGFDKERLTELVRKVRFEEKQAILSPDFGKTLPSLRLQANKLGTKLPASFFKQMLIDAQKMVENGVYKGLDKQTHQDEHIVCYIVDNKLRFGFLDPNVNELLASNEIKTRKTLIKAGILRLAENYYNYSQEEIENAPSLTLANLGPLASQIKRF